MNGLPVAVVENGETYYIRTDHIGRPVFATDATGAKVWEVSYLPFGGVHTSTGANTDLRFPGQWFQSESGLHQNWMRDYDPTTGRYMQADPLGLVDGASVYGYARQNPGRYTDPTGECIGPWAIACAGAAAGVGSVVIGFYIDKYFGDDCYTFDELVRDFTLGFAFGGIGKAWGLAGAGWRAGAAGGVWPRIGGAAGSPKNWVRIKPSYSNVGGFNTKTSITWGSNKHFQQQIGSPTLRRLNNALRNTKLPGQNWRAADPGHFHLRR